MKQHLLPFSVNDLQVDLWKYLLFVPPNQRVNSRVNGIKRNAYGVCNGQGIYTPPHVTVASFSAHQRLEPSLMHTLQEVCNNHQQFMVSLQGYAGFDCDDKSSLHIKVEDHQPLLKLVRDLRILNAILKNNGCRTAGFVNNPHLTVVRGLLHSNYTRAMHFYGNKRFGDSFIANRLVLVKRRVTDRKSQLVTTFQLPFPSCLIN